MGKGVVDERHELWLGNAQKIDCASRLASAQDRRRCEICMNFSIFQWRSLKTRITLFTLAIFLIGIWSLAFYASRMLREDMERVLGDQQLSTVTLLADEVDHELRDRMIVLEKLAGRLTPAMLGNPAGLRAFIEQILALQQDAFNGVVVDPPSAERFDPATGSSSATGPMLTQRKHHTATLLADGSPQQAPLVSLRANWR